MPIYNDPKKLKQAIMDRIGLYGQFNAWEDHLRDKPDMATSLSVVFELYDMIPDDVKNRAVNVEGIMKMHKGLACLG